MAGEIEAWKCMFMMTGK